MTPLSKHVSHPCLVDDHHPNNSSGAPIASHGMRYGLAHELLRLLFSHVFPEFRIYVAVALRINSVGICNTRKGYV